MGQIHIPYQDIQLRQKTTVAKKLEILLNSITILDKWANNCRFKCQRKKC